MTLTIGRLVLDDPESMDEGTGEAIDNVGARPVGTTRRGRRVRLGLHTLDAAFVDTVAARQTVRRQLRSVVNNRAWTTAGLYIRSSVDPEWDGWYVPEQADMTIAEAGGDAVGWYRLNLPAFRVGLAATHRPATLVTVGDMTVATSPRDYLRTVYSDHFASLTPAPVVVMPLGTVGALVSGMRSSTWYASRPVRGSVSLMPVFSGVADGDIITYEVDPDTASIGDVVAYDRRGTATLTSTGPNTAWEEVYGPDWPWSADDAPVLDNGRARISYDSGALVWEAWDGSAYVEVARIGFVVATSLSTDGLLSAGLVEYTPDRAVMRLELTDASYSSNYYSAEVYVTLQRGWSGPRVDAYKRAYSSSFLLRVEVMDSQNAGGHAMVVKQDTTVQVRDSGTGSTLTDDQTVGAASFTGENWIAMLQEDADFIVHAAVLDDELEVTTRRSSDWHGATRNGFRVDNLINKDWVGVQLAADPHLTYQTEEAEDFTAASGTSTTADGTASGGSARTATRTSAADHITRANWPETGDDGTFRILARVRTSSGTMSIRAITDTTTGSTKTTTSTSYTWLDLGDIVSDGTMRIQAWTSSGTLYVDRIDAVRVTHTELLEGARDIGQQMLAPVVPTATVVAR